MRRAAAATAAFALAFLASSCDGLFVEVPAVVKVPQENVPQFVDLPIEHPVWEGSRDTIGVLLGDDQIWESTVVSSGFQLVVGVAQNAFRDPVGMKSSTYELYDEKGMYLRIESSLSHVVFPESLAASLHPSQTRPFHVKGSTQDCPGDTICRLSIEVPAIKRYSLSQGDEYVTIKFGPRILEERTPRTETLNLKIMNDERKDHTIMILADTLEIVVGASLLFGSSNTAVMSGARHLLLLHMKCGEGHNALDHATNPAEYAVGTGVNRFYKGGLIVNLMMGFVPVLLHLSLVLLQWRCGALAMKGDSVSPHQEILRDHTDMETRCCGVTITEFRQLQATVRYPHYSSLLLLFAFQGVATCAWRLIIEPENTNERLFGFGALLVFNFGGLLFVWWKLGRGDKRRIDAVYVRDESREEEKKSRTWKLRMYLLGLGEWVSSTKRRLVHCYAILFECYREGATRFILVELLLNIFLALMGTLDAEGWNMCIVEFGIVTIGLAFFLGLCLYLKPWASLFDNHSLCIVTALQLLAMLMFIISFFLRDIASPVHIMAEYVINAATFCLIFRAFIDIVLLITDTCSGRRWRLQETFEQGQTLFQGRHCYRKTMDVFEDPDDVEGEQLLQTMAPLAASVYVRHVLPQGIDRGKRQEDEAVPSDPFEHALGCLVEEGVLLLSRKGAKKEYCPSCHSGVRVQVEEPPSKKSKKNNGGDKAGGGAAGGSFAAGDSGLRSRSKKNGGRDERDMAQPLLEDGLQRTQSSSGSHAASYTSRPRSPISRGARGTGGGGSNPLAASQRPAVSAGLGGRAASMPGMGGEWTEHVTDSGVLYYHNAKTNETSWAPPFASVTQTDRCDV